MKARKSRNLAEAKTATGPWLDVLWHHPTLCCTKDRGKKEGDILYKYPPPPPYPMMEVMEMILMISDCSASQPWVPHGDWNCCGCCGAVVWMLLSIGIVLGSKGVTRQVVPAHRWSVAGHIQRSDIRAPPLLNSPPAPMAISQNYHWFRETRSVGH